LLARGIVVQLSDLQFEMRHRIWDGTEGRCVLQSLMYVQGCDSFLNDHPSYADLHENPVLLLFCTLNSYGIRSLYTDTIHLMVQLNARIHLPSTISQLSLVP
jgi:hypothetical protein